MNVTKTFADNKYFRQGWKLPSVRISGIRIKERLCKPVELANLSLTQEVLFISMRRETVPCLKRDLFEALENFLNF